MYVYIYLDLYTQSWYKLVQFRLRACWVVQEHYAPKMHKWLQIYRLTPLCKAKRRNKEIRCHMFWSVWAYVLPIWLLFNHNSSKDSNLLTTSIPATLLWLHLRFLSDFKLDRGVREVILLWDMSKYSRLLKFDIASTSGNIYFEWEKRVLKWNERKLHQWVCWMRQWAWSGWWR